MPAAVVVRPEDLAPVRPDGPDLDSLRVQLTGMVQSRYLIPTGPVLEIAAGTRRIPCRWPAGVVLPEPFIPGAEIAVTAFPGLAPGLFRRCR